MIKNFEFLELLQLTESQKQEIIEFMTVTGKKQLLTNTKDATLPKISRFLKRFPDLSQYFLES